MKTKTREAMIYPLVAVDIPDFEDYARQVVAKRFPDFDYDTIVRQETTSRGRAVLLQVRMIRKEEG